MKNNFLILKKDSNDIFFKYIKDYNIESYYKINIRNIFLRVLIKIKSPLVSKFYSPTWKKSIKNKENNIVIMFDNGFDENIPKYIKKIDNNIKIILWLWNPVNKYSERYLKCNDLDDIWSFDSSDVKKYNIKYNTQFYTKNAKEVTIQINNDILYLGNAKNRKNEIIDLRNKIERFKIRTNFIIVENKKDYISYDKYLELISKSKCIFDYNEKGQTGLTLRPMEALFLQKKLITNNKDIKNYNFYNSNNIFILGEDNIEKIKDFIDSPYKKIDQKIIDYYDFEQWLKRFEG